MTVKVVFFDIGGTLGERDAATGRLRPYASTATLLATMRDTLGLRVGIITTLGDLLTDEQADAMLREAGVSDFLDADAFVSDHNAGAAKPDARSYRFAAERVGVPLADCLYVGENRTEVDGARAAGMQAILKPAPPGPVPGH